MTIAVVRVAIGEALLRAASLLLEGRFESVLFVGSLVLIGVAFPPVLQVAARLSRRPRLRFVPIAVAVVALVIDQKCLPDDYSGMHCVVAWGAALVGGKLDGAALDKRITGIEVPSISWDSNTVSEMCESFNATAMQG